MEHGARAAIRGDPGPGAHAPARRLRGRARLWHTGDARATHPPAPGGSTKPLPVGQISRGARPSHPGSRSLAPLLVALAALFLGSIVRLAHLLPATFPLNDGGLFYTMVQDLQRAGYRLPAEATYNAAGIPFVYPPLGFYIAGLVDQIGPWTLIDVFQWLPLALSVLTIAAFASLSRALLPNPVAAYLAMGTFALLPMGFHWLIMGGGVTRALGFLFAILTLQQVYRLYTGGGRTAVALAGALGAATVLSHPAMGWFVAYSAVVFFVAVGRSRVALAQSLLVAVVTALLTAPWWGTVLLRHGALPILATGGSSLGVFAPLQLLTLTITGEPFFPVLGALALLGALACALQRRWWLPAWLGVMVLLDARGPLASATVPLALLAGIGGAEVVLPWLAGPRGTPAADAGHARAPSAARLRRPPSRLTTAVAALALLLAVLNATVDEHAVLQGLTTDQQAAMRWVAAHTAPASEFLVVTAHRYPTRDRVAEWFPALSGRISANTVQGYEWLPGGAFARRVAAYPGLQECAYRDAACIEAWAASHAVGFTHVFLPKGPTGGESSPALRDDCCWSLRHALRADPRYAVRYDEPGATVYERVPPSGSR